jgi:enterochelin esterase-like enzyme
VRVRLLCGRDDQFLTEARQAVDVLRRPGVDVEWKETAGAHDWSTWRAHLAQVLPTLFR